MAHLDLVIRNGTIVDGSGADRFEADVAISNGKIVSVGKVTERGNEEIEAKGLLVTPGFVDVHTHYDGQATWGDELSPSSLHGVTTAIMGNCGVGFAPCKPEDRDRLIRLMEGVEDIPFPILATGLPWDWTTFQDYMDRLSAREFDIDLGAQLPHAALRVFVMGERGAQREPATEDDIAMMRQLTKAAIEAGALGFSTSRTLLHRTSEGEPTPTLTASHEELIGIALGLKDARGGVFQMVSDFSDAQEEISLLNKISHKSGRPLSVSLAQSHTAPDNWRMLLSYLENTNSEDGQMKAQVAPRPVGVLLGLELTLNPFSAHPTYQEIADRPLSDRIEALRDPHFKERLLADELQTDNPHLTEMARAFGNMFVLEDVPDYEPSDVKTLAAIAARRGVTPEEVAIDVLLQDGGRGMIYLPFLNYANGSLDPIYDMLSSAATLPGLSDGGAHVGMICDGSFPTTMLTHWTRDRVRGPKLDLEYIIKKQSRDTAQWMGLNDRGLIAPGFRADLNIIDYDRLNLSKPLVQFDLPAGGRRLMQYAEGYVATIVAGDPILRDGNRTGAKPGRLVRGSRAQPH